MDGDGIFKRLKIEEIGCPVGGVVISFECEDRKRLQQQYLRAVNAYGEAVGKARSPKCADPDLARQLTQDTGAACEKALRAFTVHIEEHGC